ncbi:precorrin-2 dehydrogenase/sirohydrochlorin ferrochelatase [Cryptococcus wingfieldii CBS 7118]|uniref:precorrin-2 dehydrogenase n=1 Tax=Cryptococcus wingfieldii CBS 7118 TaxID=1295528 RepID=A0A1E3JZ70_9TREE|nr:precorrin-2 dehydrogenase/sirohydrochlorin ferrochelatase [Cryptococcus wingfieldii CBS 7118]ODO06150.1 precorrin-2 dehydrogenase/sirohydrochlorin ferrochelatase [Cryptococcus wingfieldii CBS 7118]
MASERAVGPSTIPKDASIASLPSTSYPPIHQGASLLLALRLQDRPILLIGGGVVAASRVYFLLESGAHITLIAPLPLDPSIAHYISHPDTASQFTHLAREFKGREDEIKVKDFDLVLTAIDDNDLSKEVCEICREARVMVNVADIPPQCDFYFGAQMRRGPLQILISTGGMGPRAGAMLRDLIVDALPSDVESSLQGVGALRRDLRERAPGVGGERGQRRMDWMKQTCDKWGLAEMGRFNDEPTRTRVLEEGWEKGVVLGPSDLEGEIGSGWWKGLKGKVGPEGVWGVSGLALGAAIATTTTLWLSRRR